MTVEDISPKRHQEVLYRSDGSAVSTSALNLHSNAYMKVRRFGFRQDRLGVAEVLVEGRADVRDEDIEEFIKELSNKTGRGLRFLPRIVPTLSITENGKERLVDQRCEVPR
jgi:phenylacetate-CoA ligase